MAVSLIESKLTWLGGRGISHPKGFLAGTAACGLKKGRADLTLIVSDRQATVAGVFTKNLVRASSVDYSKAVAQTGSARSIFCKAGNANACTGPQGEKVTEDCASLAAELLGIQPQEVLVAATGVIGRQVPFEAIAAGLPLAAQALGAGAESDRQLAMAIATTDTFEKYAALTLTSELWQGELRIGGVCKGSGMIAPNMATTLCFLTTDAYIEAPTLQLALQAAIDRSFNRLTVDGDTSTNDMALVMANGAGSASIPVKGPAFDGFAQALEAICVKLAKMIAQDGEGATKLVEIVVSGAPSEAEAAKVAKTVAESPLVKTALFGHDPNWGRIVAAAGRAGVTFDPLALRLSIGGVEVFKAGQPTCFNLESLSQSMQADEVLLHLDLGAGHAEATVWTCDLSYDYVRINAEYTT